MSWWAVVLGLVGCAPSLDSAADTAACASHEAQITWESGGEGFFLTWCRSCHSESVTDRHGAPEYLNYDTLEGVREAAHNIRQAAIWDQVMPPSYPLGDEEREQLMSFLDCGL